MAEDPMWAEVAPDKSYFGDVSCVSLLESRYSHNRSCVSQLCQCVGQHLWSRVVRALCALSRIASKTHPRSIKVA
eukprot:3916249-Rhodomonas_salina.1